jgi:hypothetical protein
MTLNYIAHSCTPLFGVSSGAYGYVDIDEAFPSRALVNRKV